MVRWTRSRQGRPGFFFRRGVTRDWLEFVSDDEQDYLTARLRKPLPEIGNWV